MNYCIDFAARNTPSCHYPTYEKCPASSAILRRTFFARSFGFKCSYACSNKDRIRVSEIPSKYNWKPSSVLS